MARKRSKKKKKAAAKVASGKEPGYMVQIPEPGLVRRDVLESLREVIIFMQSYEKFKRIQEEKKKYISELKLDLKELSSLLTGKLKFYFPIGKLTAIGEKLEADEEEAEDKKYVSSHRREEKRSSVEKPEIKHSELDELESQLKDIESQLQGIQ